MADQDTFNQPHLNLMSDMTFSLHRPSTRDSLILGRWQTDPETQRIKLTNESGQLLWAPRWDTVGNPTTLSFRQEGETVVYHKLK